MAITWHCEICKKERPNAAISVHKIDTSEANGLPPGSSGQNIKYCNDNPDCSEGARQKGREELERAYVRGP